MKNTVFKSLVAIIMFLTLVVVPNPNGTLTYAESEGTGEASQNGLLVKYYSPDSEYYRTVTEVELLEDVDSVEVIAPQVELLTLAEGTDLETFKAQLENNPAVELVEPNYERQLYGVVNDAYFSDQWWVPHTKAESLWAHASSQKKKSRRSGD